MAQRPSGWHRTEISDALRRKYGPITHLSCAWGYSPQSITTCLLSPAYSRPLELRIAEALELAPHVLWPDRWDQLNNPLPRTRVRKTATIVAVPARQKREAA